MSAVTFVDGPFWRTYTSFIMFFTLLLRHATAFSGFAPAIHGRVRYNLHRKVVYEGQSFRQSFDASLVVDQPVPPLGLVRLILTSA